MAIKYEGAESTHYPNNFCRFEKQELFLEMSVSVQVLCSHKILKKNTNLSWTEPYLELA